MYQIPSVYIKKYKFCLSKTYWHIGRGGIAPLIHFIDHSTGACYTYSTVIRRMGTAPAKDGISQVYGLTPI